MMKRPLLSLFMSAVLLVTVNTACDKLPMNGDLDGMWQLVSEERDSVTTNLLDTRHYISFQLHTAQFSTLTNTRSFYSRFRHTSDSLQFYTICYNSTNATEADDNVPVTADSLSQLAPWGIYELTPTFRIVKLNDHALVLQSSYSRLTFRKF